MKRVLIFADIFPPAFAPRAAYLTKYLLRFGWEPYVITEKMPAPASQSHGDVFGGFCTDIPITAIDLSSPSYAIRSARLFGELLWEQKEKRFYEEAVKAFPDVRFDAVLCLTYRKFPLAAACRYARAHRLPWVADCRDVVEQYSNYDFLPRGKRLPSLLMRWLRSRYISLRNRYLREADHIVSVSPWHCNLLAEVNPRTELIYNGYDPELFSRGSLPCDKFILSYTGRLLTSEMHDPTLLFEALASEALQEVRKERRIELHWYVDEHSRSILQPLIRQYGLADMSRFFPMVPALQVPEILRRSSILLQLGNTEKPGGPHGIVSTKLFESLAMEKPILMVRSDEAIVADIISKAEAGLAARTTEEVATFLNDQYTRWKAEGDTSLPNSNRDFISTFSRKEQAGQYARLLETIVAN
ncbi:glycosyltransferase [Porphyromonas gulae]|uniref:glycosyltransferase n=1 Tax=Porphyromonas gulae TaxID=111105 RepID=UPI00051CD4C3|nr:glycosyltransferase [Porphyromonas gulae]KGL47665.1 glycosyl transferase family 1 [Porphyromonas gulae]